MNRLTNPSTALQKIGIGIAATVFLWLGLVVSTSIAHADEGDPLWTRALPALGRQDNPAGVVAEGDDVYVVGTIFPASNMANSYVRLERRNAQGDVADWVSIDPTARGDAVGAIAMDATGIYVAMRVGGSIRWPFADDASIRIEKRSKNNLSQVLWWTTVNPVAGGGLDAPTSITIDTSGVYVGAVGGSAGGGDGRWYIAKFGLHHGNNAPPLWVQRNHTSDWAAYLHTIEIGPGGRIFAIGTSGAYDAVQCREEIFSSAGAYLGARNVAACSGASNVGPYLSTGDTANGVLYAGGYSRTGGINTARTVIEFQNQNAAPMQTYVDTTTNGISDLSANSDGLFVTASILPSGGFSITTPATNWVRKINQTTQALVWSKQVSFIPHDIFATENVVYLVGMTSSGGLNPEVRWYVEKRGILPDQPDLTALTPAINTGTLTTGSTLTFRADARNIGPANAATAFSNRFQIDFNSDGTYDVNLDAPNSVPDLAAGADRTVTSPSWTAVAGTHRIRMCADSPTSAVIESNEGNNCGPEYAFTVTAPPNQPPTATITTPATNVRVLRGNTISFEGTGTDTDGTITAWQWSDGACRAGRVLSTAASFTKNDFTPVPHTIYFRVQDNDGAWSPCDSVVVTVTNPAQCNDSTDNDGDGRNNYPADPGCSSPTDNNEGGDPVCNDTLDNDGDGDTDYPSDPGCSNGTDVDEGPNPACSDNIDNDGDGLQDENDPGCHTDVDSGNAASYDPRDTNEFNIGSIRPR